MTPVFDLHVHVQPWEELKPEVAARFRAASPDHARLAALMHDPGALLALLDREGIARIGMINYVAPEVMGFTPRVNDYVAEIARHAPDRLLAFGSVHPRLAKAPGREVERLHGMGIRALKIHPPHQLFAANAYLDDLPGLREIYATAQALRMPVMIHTGTSVFAGARNRYADPMPCDDVAVDFPDLTLILAHAGRPLYCDTCFFLARRHPNVHLDVSGIPPRRLLSYLPRLPEIADKVLWGTDWPDLGVAGLRANVEEFRGLGLPDDVERKVLWDNADRLFPTA